MFYVKVDDLTLWSPIDNKLKIVSPTLKLEVNKIGSFSFKIYPDHKYYNRLEKMKSIISVYQGERTLFKGRVYSDNFDFHKVRKVEVEGLLGYFNDSIVRPYEFSGSVTGYFTALVNQHNEQVTDAQKFKVGKVTVTDPNDLITRSSANAVKTWDEINNKLIKLLGGYISIRYEEDGNYVDYLADYSDTSTQAIAFAVNLLDLELENKADSLSTCIIPYGAKGEDGKKIDITSVNDGVDYIYDADAVAKYGRIFEVVTWEDVTLPANLLSKARLYLADKIKLLSKLTVKAIDLHLADETIEAFKLGDYVQIFSEPHGIDERVLLTAYSMDLTNPSGCTITLGLEKSSFLGEQMEANKDSENRVDIVIKDVDDLKKTVKLNVKSVNVLYYLSTSDTELIGGEWVDTPPERGDGFYYWQKTVTTYTDGTSGESVPVCITVPGKDGVGIKTIIEQYYLSTSSSTQSGGSWSDTCPEYKNGYYIWTRSKIVLTDDNVSYTDPVLANALNNANQNAMDAQDKIDNLIVGGRNYLRKTDVTKYFADWSPWGSTLELTNDGWLLVSPSEGASGVGAYPPKLSTIEAGETYTVSFEAYAEDEITMNYFYIMADGGNKTLGKSLDITTVPKKYSFTFDVTETVTNCSILFGYNSSVKSTFCIRNPKLEKGNKATDWTPAPEDNEVELDRVKEETYTYVNELVENSEETTRTMLQEYASVSDLETVRSEMSTTISQTAEDIDIRFNTVDERITEENGEIVRILEKNSKYIRLVDGNIILGEEGAPLTTKIANGRISFLYNDTVEVAYISEQKLYITKAEIIESIVIGNFAYIPRPNGNLSFKKI